MANNSFGDEKLTHLRVLRYYVFLFSFELHKECEKTYNAGHSIVDSKFFEVFLFRDFKRPREEDLCHVLFVGPMLGFQYFAQSHLKWFGIVRRNMPSLRLCKLFTFVEIAWPQRGNLLTRLVSPITDQLTAP